MFPGGAGAPDWGSDMQLTGRVVLSAAALLLVTAAYRLLRSRPAQAPPQGGHANADGRDEAEGGWPPAVQGASPGALHKGPRRRRTSKRAEAPLGSSGEILGGSCALSTVSRDGEPNRRTTSEEGTTQGLDSAQVPLPCKEAGAALVGKPDPCLAPHLGCDPQSSPSRLLGGDGSLVGSEPTPWRGCRPPEPSAAGEPGSPHQHWLMHREGGRNMNKSWVLTRVSGVHREEAGALQATSDLGLALKQQEGARDACYTFSSMAQVRVEENFIRKKATESRPRLRGKVYEYYVESTSQASLVPRAVVLAGAPPPVPRPLLTSLVAGGHGETTGGGAEAASSSPPTLAAMPGFSRKTSLLQIAENPELQLQLCGFGAPTHTNPLCPDSNSDNSSREPRVQLIAGTNFFHLPLSPSSAPNVHLDLGNCYEVLTLAKRQHLGALKEAAYKVMTDNYLQVLRSPDIYNRLSGAERELILRRRLCGRQCLVVADVCPQEESGRLCCYDDEQDTWHPLAGLPQEAVSWGCAICSLFNYLFVVSGCQGRRRQASTRVFCYNPLTGIWSEVSPLNQARPHCRLVALDGHLYAIGGECLHTVERYDPRLDRWDFAPPLPNDTFALAHTATACAGEIFVTGGTLRYLLLRFSAQEQRWWAGPTGGGRDRTVEMVAVSGFLYRFDLNRSLGIGVYRCSASTRLWYECATRRTPYPDAFQCAVVDNRIYCVGRRRTLGFLADHVSPRFVPEELQSFPSPQGTLLPTVLTLPAPGVPQTRV
ncbi:kelch domain-containing protein 7A [Echinops telfairi]|uniref:Kelch domain-containing protein 7A n=1 Tax=Echinops telfairi TaxID=9371 RepID=A0ABM0IQ72_ECHTE|nr:kelch domain-containing protein 7A [Echinops telfairi]